MAILISADFAATHDFIPDLLFKGSSLTGWQPIGHADWRANNGEITGTPKAQEGGWLMLDKGYQDLEFYTDFRCSAPCTPGVLFRAEKTSGGGLKGIYVSLADGDSGAYDVVLDAEGKELSRTKLERSTAQFARMAAGPSTNGQAQVPGFAKPAPTLAEQVAEAA